MYIYHKILWCIVVVYCLQQVKDDGVVYGVNAGKTLYVREGVTANKPTGTHWRAIAAPSLNHISAGSSSLLGVDLSQSILRFNGELN